jgi:hypothetical protein
MWSINPNSNPNPVYNYSYKLPYDNGRKED